VIRIRHVLALAAALAAVAAPAAQAAPPRVTANSAIVIDARDGRALYEKAADARRPIASATKLMTALLVLEQAKLSDTMTAGRYRSLAAESKINLREGERMTVADLLRGLLVYSANDAADTLAAGVAGSTDSFVREMNRRAQQLGLTGTRYANPVGLDEAGNYSTARDLTKLVMKLREFPFFRRTARARSVTLRSGSHVRTLANRNELVRRFNWIDGVKTGHTLQAGYVLVASSRRGGVPLVSVVLGTPSDGARYTDTLALFTYAVGRYHRVEPVKQREVVAQVPIRYRAGAKLDLITARSVHRVVRRGSQPFKLRVVGLPDEVEGPIAYRQRIARVEVLLDGRVATRVGLLAANDVPEAGLGRKTQDAMTRPWTIAVLAAILLAAMALTRLRRPPIAPADHRPREAGAA
jgi:D-alanyl-D-alanine carboxypeptidase (penicillin-binding protein 5/6)